MLANPIADVGAGGVIVLKESCVGQRFPTTSLLIERVLDRPLITDTALSPRMRDLRSEDPPKPLLHVKKSLLPGLLGTLPKELEWVEVASEMVDRALGSSDLLICIGLLRSEL